MVSDTVSSAKGSGHPHDVALDIEGREVTDEQRLVRHDAASPKRTPNVDDLEAGVLLEGVDAFVGGGAADDGTAVSLRGRDRNRIAGRKGNRGREKEGKQTVSIVHH